MMKTWSKIAISVIVILMLLSPVTVEGSQPENLAPSNWPMFQHDNRHTGQSPHVGITSFPMLRWEMQVPGYCGESATGISEAADGTIYVSACGNLSAINPEDGTILWTVTGGNTSRSTPAIAADGTIYWGFADSFVAITPTGEIKWEWTDLSGNYVFGSSPAIAEDGSIYVTHDALFSFSENGDLRWVHRFIGVSHSSPAIGPDGTIYVGSEAALSAFEPNGNVKWRRDLQTADNSPVIGSDGTIYIGTSEAQLFAYDPDGNLLWEFRSDEFLGYDSSVHEPPVIATDGTIYFGTRVYSNIPVTDFAHIYAVNPDGSLKWKFPVYRLFKDRITGVSVPFVVDRDGNLFACSINGLCYGFNAATGNTIWECAEKYSSTAMYIPSDGKMLMLATYILLAYDSPTDRIFLPFVTNH